MAAKKKAEAFFLDGMTVGDAAPYGPDPSRVSGHHLLRLQAVGESEGDSGIASTGWETFLGAVIRAGLGISGTWPIRTELGNRMIGMGTNALASSIVLVCRPRPVDAPVATRREFVDALRGGVA